MNKENYTLTILKLIQTSSVITIDIIDTITYFGYAETYRRICGLKSEIPKRRPILEKQIKKLEERQKISKLIYKLKKEGFIKIKSGSKDSSLITTKKGDDYVKKMFSKESLNKTNYDFKPSQEFKIITFDIPESERNKRKWLRSALKNLKFNMLQQSVWVGSAVLPEEFFEDLHNKNLMSFIEIFAVTKFGSLKRLEK